MIYFPEVNDTIQFEGRDSRNPLAFRHYDSSKEVGDRTMEEHLRFAVCYWHTFRGVGTDPFGQATMRRTWHRPGEDALVAGYHMLDAAFEFFQKLGVKYWTFHDRDLVDEGHTPGECHKNLERVVHKAKTRQEECGIQLLWGTANLFSHPRYMCGAATNPDPHVFAYAACQVKHALEATHELGGLGYVFWGGREGYDTLLNTDLKREREQLARFLHMALDHARTIGFEGQFYIEPKPCEPTKHQYDSDVEACLNFLREFDLFGKFKLNIESNHATLAGHSLQHELRVARVADSLGSVDANIGDDLLGWDTDQFPTNLYSAIQAMFEVLAMGGFKTGGLNFDAKVRRASNDALDLFYAHIGAMDTFARALEIAYSMHQDGRFEDFLQDRYSGWDKEFGQQIMNGQATLSDCAEFALHHGEPRSVSGRQEMLENWVNEFIF